MIECVDVVQGQRRHRVRPVPGMVGNNNSYDHAGDNGFSLLTSAEIISLNE